jgi:FlaA1/EpsC-like NDP-sugar epimerase
MKGGLSMNIKKTKLKRLSGIIKIIFDVFFWAAIVLGTVSFLIFIVILFVPEEIFIVSGIQKGWSISMIGGVMKYNIDPNLYSSINFKPFLQAILPTVTVISLMFLLIVHNLRSILKTVADDHPFEKNNSRRLLIIGIILMAGSVILKIAEGITAMAIIDTLEIKNVDVVFTVDGAMLLTGFLVLILAGVFRYGSYLQDEYDATL